jgi:hypothetical protein
VPRQQLGLPLSHPADFTPVCRSEFGNFAYRKGEMRDEPAVCGTGLIFSGGYSALGHPTYGTSPLKSLAREREPSALAAPPCQPPQRTAGLRTAGRSERDGRDVGLPATRDADKAAVWHSPLSFSGGLRGVTHHMGQQPP